MYGERIITGIPSRRYYDCRRAYRWLMTYMRQGYELYYKATPESCRATRIYKITLKGNSLWVITAKSNIPLDGVPLVIKDSSGKVIDRYRWKSRPYRYKKPISKDCIKSKKAWIKYRLGSGELRCYPESSETPFVITNLYEDEGGMYSVNEGRTKKVYLAFYYIYYTDMNGNTDVHKNW